VDVYLDVTTDGGARFTPAATEPLHVRTLVPAALSQTGVPIAARGSDVWVLGKNVIYESTDTGGQWTAVRTRQTLSSIALAGDGHAVGTSGANCESNTGGCWQTDYLVVTSDGGRTWHAP
jgi:hypothetical protein